MRRNTLVRVGRNVVVFPADAEVTDQHRTVIPLSGSKAGVVSSAKLGKLWQLLDAEDQGFYVFTGKWHGLVLLAKRAVRVSSASDGLNRRSQQAGGARRGDLYPLGASLSPNVSGSQHIPILPYVGFVWKWKGAWRGLG